MSNKPPVNLYETSLMHAVTGPAIRPGYMELTKRAIEFCRLPESTNILDVGCGSGATLSHLKKHYNFKAAGVDLSRALLEKADHSNGKLALIQANASTLPVTDERFGAVFCECVLSLLKDPRAALIEWHRVLESGGYLIVADLYARNPSKKQGEKKIIDVNCCLNGAVDTETVYRRMSAAGFNILLFEDHTALLKNLAAQLAWTYGSLEVFLKAAGSTPCANTDAFSGRPGYYLMVARKGELGNG